MELDKKYDAQIFITIGPEIKKDSVRDAVKFIQFNDFVNQLDFAEVSRIINFIIKKKISGTLNVGTGRGVSLNFLINQISKKYKFKTIVKTSKIKDKIVADISLLKSYKYKFKYNEKYIDF